MTTTTTTDVRTRVNELLDYIRNGKILEAMDEFYAENASMQENANAPTVGRQANIEREKEFLASVKAFTAFEVKSIGVDGDTALVESAMEFVAQDGSDVRAEQVSVTRWKDGQIVHERFYYDSAAK